MTSKAYSVPMPFREKVRLVILDLDCFLYPYDKTYRNAVLRAWREIRKEYGLPIFRKKVAQKLIAEAKEQAKRNPDDSLCGCISKLASSLESKGFSGASVIGMLEIYLRSRKAARLGEVEKDTRLDRAIHSPCSDPPSNDPPCGDSPYNDPAYNDPPYKEMIAMAYNLRLLKDCKSGKKGSLTPAELQEKIVQGDKGITRLWHRHMGTGFLRADDPLVSKIQRLKDAGVEVAILTHSFKHGEGEALEKLEKLGLGKVISEQNVFGVEEISPHRKGAKPEVFDRVLAAFNGRRDRRDPIKPIETIMAEDTIGNLEGAKKAGMQTVWVPRRDRGLPNRRSRNRQRKLASVDHVYATPHEFLDAVASRLAL